MTYKREMRMGLTGVETECDGHKFELLSESLEICKLCKALKIGDKIIKGTVIKESNEGRA